MYTNTTTVLHQLLTLLPEQQFQAFVGQHDNKILVLYN